ncbi:hypothetical protein ABT173_35250 [Streptomyces sp. NPDC001795]|uniref:hypothetical protein n=1 Tax=Streptomyces sp. NPDC001795 TaxID=3154525 RepID=UPI003322D697
MIGSFVFRDGVSDHGLHTLGIVLVAAGSAVLLLTVLNRRLISRDTSSRNTPSPAEYPTKENTS